MVFIGTYFFFSILKVFKLNLQKVFVGKDLATKNCEKIDFEIQNNP